MSNILRSFIHSLEEEEEEEEEKNKKKVLITFFNSCLIDERKMFINKEVPAIISHYLIYFTR